MIRIFSDSTCDLSKELIERYDITILPLHILLGEEEFLDGVDITPDEIYKWSDEHKTTPKTSAVSIEDVMKAAEPYLDQGDEIISFSISDDMSTSGNVMHMAAAELEAEDRFHVINSANLSTGIGLLVIEAAIMAKEGKASEEIITKIEEHPKIVVENGAMNADKKYRGKIAAVIMAYVKDIEEDLKNARPDRVFITHSGSDPKVVQEVYDYLEGLHYFDEICITRAGGVVSSHCGYGTLGVLYIANE